MEDINIGEKVRSFRIARGISLRDLAAKTELSPSMLSQIENNAVNPSINALKSIAHGLDISLYKFFKEETEPNQLVVRKGEYKIIGQMGEEVQYKLLTADVSGMIECCLMDIPAGESSGNDEYGHVGEEVAYIIHGETDINLNGTIYHLRAGDAIKIPPKTPHQWTNHSPDEVQVIFSVTPPSF